eukprot:scaffold12169_cov132-Cylindrotheca_fusiformis.AAC.12
MSHSSTTTTIVAATAAAMVTMAGTMWFLSHSAYDDDESSVGSYSSIGSSSSYVADDMENEVLPAELEEGTRRRRKSGLRMFWSSRNNRSNNRKMEGIKEEEDATTRISSPTMVGGQTIDTTVDTTTTSIARRPSDAGPFARFRYKLRPLRLEAWSEPSAQSFQIRGPTYLKDGKKVSSEAAAFSLMTVDMIQCETPQYKPICGHPRERVQQAIKRELETGTREMPDFIFAVNLCIPAGRNQYYHQVSYFAVDNMEEIQKAETPFGKLMKEFIFGDSDKFRDRTFKLIPRIVKGNMLVRRAVGSKPSVLGTKIQQHYYRGDRYFEMIVDIASDPVAQRVVKLALGFAKTLVTDICFVLEGTDNETLPERIFGGVTLKYIDLKNKDGCRTIVPWEES